MEKKPPTSHPIEKPTKAPCIPAKNPKKMVALITIGQNQSLARLNAGLFSNSSCAFWSSDLFVKTERSTVLHK
jgi:hypothetical protein